MPDPRLRGPLVETFQLLKVRDFFMFLEPSQRAGSVDVPLTYKH